MADPNTFVFGKKIKERLKMISVDATGKRTGTGRIGPSNDVPGVVTKENWESSDKLSLDYNVEDMNMACVGMIICKLHSDYQGLLSRGIMSTKIFFYKFRSNNTQNNI